MSQLRERKRKRLPDAPGLSTTVYKGDSDRELNTFVDQVVTLTCSTLGSAPASNAGHLGFDSQHAQIILENWSPSSFSHPSNLIESQRPHSPSPVPQEHHLSEPPDEGLARIYIPPPPPTATPQQMYSLCYPVPPPKRRRANSPENCKSMYGPARGSLCPSRDPMTASATGTLDRTGVG